MPIFVGIIAGERKIGRCDKNSTFATISDVMLFTNQFVQAA